MTMEGVYDGERTGLGFWGEHWEVSLSVSQGYGMKSNPERHKDLLEIGLFKRETPGLSDHSIAIVLNFLKNEKQGKM